MDFYFSRVFAAPTVYPSFNNCGLLRKWTFFGIILTILLLENVDCENAWEIQNNTLVGISEEVPKVSIVGYNKDKMTTVQIEEERKRIENECGCNVENLASVGAFILTYEKPAHQPISSLNLDPSKEIGVEDQVVTISNEDIPTDPDFNRQWALQDLPNNADINAVEGWEEYTMSDFKGHSVIVAVIDTGVDYNHPDLKDAMWTNPEEIPGNGKDDDGNGIVDDVFGADFNSPSSGDPIDRQGHGTHCAGIIAARENNENGIAGVASFAEGKTKIMAIKGLSDHGKGSLSNLLKGLNYAIKNGATISSNSWGCNCEINEATAQLWKMVLGNNPDHLFVAAAGNANKFLNDNYRPIICGIKQTNLLCVASSTDQDKKSWFSNYGKDYVHVFAPGSYIYSTVPNNKYKYLNGTSMACPHVSGLAALIRTMRPDINAQQVREVIETNVQKKADYKNLVSSGGIIDMGKSIRALKDKTCSRWTTPVGGCLWNYNDDPIANISSVENCQRKCAEISWCRSVDYIVDRRECYLNWETAFTKSSRWYSVCYNRNYPEIFRSSVYSEKVEIRPGSPSISSVYSASYSAERCMDGYLDTYCYNKKDGDEKPFFMIEYTSPVRVNHVRLITAEFYPQHANNIVVTVTNDTTSSGTQFGPIYKGPATKGGEVINFQPKTAVMGKYVIVKQDKGVITFAEVKVNTG